MSSKSYSADQRALASWILAGLTVPEVRELHGDAAYLLNNMIAKFGLFSSQYAISEGALAVFQANNIDLSRGYARRTFYGQSKPFTYDHAVPVLLAREQLLCDNCSEEQLYEVLDAVSHVAVLLRNGENDMLNGKGLRSRMPDGWRWGDDPYARYEAAGIRISSARLLVRGAVCR